MAVADNRQRCFAILIVAQRVLVPNNAGRMQVILMSRNMDVHIREPQEAAEVLRFCAYTGDDASR
ncbi:MAG TPA: hypothetical protein VFY25_16495 [Anaerolineales bacterium]|nr:hypothetical protein [Anaerolineales bacterium]